VVIEGGRMRVGAGPIERADTTVRFRSPRAMRDFFDPSFNQLDLIIDNQVALEGNISALAWFGHMTNCVLLGGRQRPLHPAWAAGVGPARWQDLPAHRAGEPCRERPAGEVSALDDPHLAGYTLDDFPRIKRLLWVHRTTVPEICTERARLLTEFELKERGRSRNGGGPPPLHAARALRHVLARKEPIIRDDDLLAGTTTSRRVGVPIYPELGGTWLWSELLTSGDRALNPYIIHDEDVKILDRQVFPHWLDDNVRQWAYDHGGRPEVIDLDMRFALYFMWKSQAISHTVIDVPRALSRGLLDLRDEAARREAEAAGAGSRAFYRGLQIALEAVVDYSRRLARRAAELADEVEGEGEAADARRRELREMARVCEKVPARPAETLHEAVQAIWTLFVAQLAESFNAAIVLGRLDLWLEPFFRKELDGVDDPAERRRRVERALELACALMLKATDSLPLKVSAGNRIFSGSSGDYVITLGGVTAEGASAVSDMTWIFLKATEMLRLRDPNVNARFAPGVNSEAYLRRLCEVNALTGATPSLHNDDAVVPALLEQGFTLEHARDWTATGCVEPTSCGRHYGHTNSMMFNMVGALEMALHDGVHPLIGDKLGPGTGDPRSFASYDQVREAVEAQLGWLIDTSCDANNVFGRAHQQIKPTPLLSALFTGPMEAGRDLVDGGAVYNTSGVAMVGLTDVVDSLAAIKALVFDRRRIDLPTLLDALDADFEGPANEALRQEILRTAPKFGRDDGALAQEIARDLMRFVYDRFQAHEHYRGGRYLPGYWSMSYHVAFGALSGALPSGRKKGKAFTPGLTPSHLCGAGLTEQIRTVAALDPRLMPNNIAFNVKVVPGAGDTHAAVVDRLAAYVGAYFELGGMQLQFNVVSTATLRHAVTHPEEHRDLLVRISGYNVYFVDLTPEAQLEVIERAEHSLSARA
jgi:formate C-acetyltransferase